MSRYDFLEFGIDILPSQNVQTTNTFETFPQCVKQL